MSQEFEKIYKKHQQTIYRYIYSRIRNIDTADDICQDVFFRFFNKLENEGVNTIKNTSEIKTFLIGSARNACIDHYRKEEAKAKLETTLQEMATIKERESTYEKAEIIAEKFAKDETEKLIYLYKTFHGFTYKEIRKLLREIEIDMSIEQIKYSLLEMKKRITAHVLSQGITKIEDLLE